ncbi:hypothetical protein H5410_055251 [Solanum commersonii]|uniref:Uncharacterized protein n=1 Tax=Solanum commersonii TaxID=4109 RepID=A0A9J5WI57_SOLCO|nr:hypothetical protein H5410_055251 [Solanum commersonii]
MCPHPSVPWRRLMCNNPGLSKWLFILYVTIHDRLFTKDRMLKWRMQLPTCGEEYCIGKESIDKLQIGLEKYSGTKLCAKARAMLLLFLE